jgi:acylphosphatase
MDMKVHLNIKVIGKVQGVFFRAFIKKKADELGINGLVKNLPDGSVYIEAEGEKPAMDDFLKWGWKGSLTSQVKKVETVSSEMKNYIDFKILH